MALRIDIEDRRSWLLREYRIDQLTRQPGTGSPESGDLKLWLNRTLERSSHLSAVEHFRGGQDNVSESDATMQEQRTLNEAWQEVAVEVGTQSIPAWHHELPGDRWLTLLIYHDALVTLHGYQKLSDDVQLDITDPKMRQLE